MHRQLLGLREESLELVDGSTVEEAWARLTEHHPQLSPSGPVVRFARNREYADPTEALADGDELAVIPPVAGGAATAGRAGADTARAASLRRRLALTSEPIDDAQVADLGRYVATHADGAVVSFLGRTRESPGTPAPGEEAAAQRYAGQSVVGLTYEAYEEMALAVLESIADEISERFGVTGLAIVHRTGSVAVGETSVAIAAAAAHRHEAFEACRYAIEELKARAPIWKSERFADGSVWLGAPVRER
jgi:molybdopterin synthase catalytic subunit/molybdopterin converting factor small subunit